MTVSERQKSVIQAFSKYLNWEQRYQYLIQLGKAMPHLAEEYKVEKNKVKGCQSLVWLHAHLEQDKVIYEADSDALIVRGLAALLISVYSGHTPSEILSSDGQFLTDIGLTSHLSQSRANGLAALVRQFKNYAIAFQMMLESKT